MARGPFSTQLPIVTGSSPVKRYVSDAKWDELVNSIYDWTEGRNANGFGIAQLGSIGLAGNGQITGNAWFTNHIGVSKAPDAEYRIASQAPALAASDTSQSKSQRWDCVTETTTGAFDVLTLRSVRVANGASVGTAHWVFQRFTQAGSSPSLEFGHTYLMFGNLPATSAGQPAGAIWRDSNGFLRQV